MCFELAASCDDCNEWFLLQAARNAKIQAEV